MRIVTWNLAQGRARAGGIAAQESQLTAIDGDIEVLTEVPTPVRVPGRDVVMSPDTSMDERWAWVAIRARGIEPVSIEIPYERLAVAGRARLGAVECVIYGSVLPWRAAPSQVSGLRVGDESYQEMFQRFLSEQESDIRGLRNACPEALVIWAGDFNQELVGPNRAGSQPGRQALSDTLGRLGLAAWNASAPAHQEGGRAIDLICGPAGMSPVRVESFGRELSDHLGYAVEIE